MAEQPKTVANTIKTPNVSISVPETIKIKLVDASLLSEYETWAGIAAFMSNVTVALWVWYFQNKEPLVNSILLFIASISSILLIILVTLVIVKKNKMRKKSKEIEYPLGAPNVSE